MKTKEIEYKKFTPKVPFDGYVFQLATQIVELEYNEIDKTMYNWVLMTKSGKRGWKGGIKGKDLMELFRIVLAENPNKVWKNIHEYKASL